MLEDSVDLETVVWILRKEQKGHQPFEDAKLFWHLSHCSFYWLEGNSWRNRDQFDTFSTPELELNVRLGNSGTLSRIF
jgi:hypothetical protein